MQPTGLAAMAQLGIGDEVMAHGAKVDCLYGVNAVGRRVIDIRYGRWKPGMKSRNSAAWPSLTFGSLRMAPTPNCETKPA